MRVNLLSKKSLIVILRWLLLFVASYFVVFDGRHSSRIQPALLAVFVASNLALGFVSLERFRRWRLNYTVVVFDVLFITAMICLARNPGLYFLFFFTIPVALISSFMADESREEEERLVWAHVVLGMNQELAAAPDRERVFAIVRETLLRIPRVRDVRLFCGSGDGYRAAGAGPEEGMRVWSAAELGVAAGPAGGATSLFFHAAVPARKDTEGPHPPRATRFAAFPFATSAGARGLLLVYPVGSERFGERVCEVFSIAAMSLARSLEHLDAFAEISRRATEIASLMEVNQVINSTLDLDEVLRRVMAQSTRLLESESAALMLLDETSQELVFEVATGEKGSAAKQVRLKLGEGIAGWVAREGQPLIVNDPASDGRFFQGVDRKTGYTTRNILAVPLQVRGRVIGVLEVLNSLPPARPFTDADLRLLQAVENQASTAIEKARLYRYMEEQVNETIEMYLSLEKEKGKVEAILASMVEGVLVCDEQGSVNLVNEKARLALSSDGISWLPEHGRVLELLRRSCAEFREFSETIAPETTGRRIYRVRVAPMRTNAGKFLGAVAVLEDATELIRLSELKSEFISQVSHELRTPLTSMRGALGLLTRGRAGPISPEQLGLLSLVQEEIGRMTSLINDLLDLSKLESGVVRLELEDLEVRPLAERLLEGLQVLVAEKQQTLAREWAPGLPPVRADRRRLERVFANLVGNAIKYTPAGGAIRVGAEIRQPGTGEGEGTGPAMALFWVRDSGPGIPAEDRQRVFEKFQRGRGPAVEGIQGTGLGLAIVRQIIEEHGGKIWIEEAPGGGGVFFFTLPLAAPGLGAAKAWITGRRGDDGEEDPRS